MHPSFRHMAQAFSIALLVSTSARTIAEQQIPRPEHPFPQMLRGEWLNLNGPWEFGESDDVPAAVADAKWLAPDAKYPDTITVPFCRESKLSGLARRGFIKNVWYRRTFQRPDEWKAPRTRLHIGASDYRTRVWLNGRLLGEHVGGSTPFWFDVTQHLQPGENTVIVHAFDDTRSGLQPLGKQSPEPESHGCVYTRTTGIWQTVWLEGVGDAFIRDVRIEPDVANGRVLLQAEIDGACAGLTLEAVARAGEKEVGRARTPADWRNSRLVLDLSEKRLWQVGAPFLYDLELKLLRGSDTVDEVDSYFGLRDVTIKGAAILINGQPVFQRTVLDQGFYPDGVWTAPGDADLRGDIERSLAAGFNGARLHEKVFDPRFLYWADKLGYLVWGEFPNWGVNYKNPASHGPYIDEWLAVLRRDRNHPSIVGWCPFNETPADAVGLQNIVVNLTRAFDPARPVIDSSGWAHGLPDPEVLDAHDYDQNPESFRAHWTDGYGPQVVLPARYRNGQEQPFVPFFVSEYGGIGFSLGGGAWGYGQAAKDVEELHKRYEGLTNALLDNRYMFGFCYTQLTDVEQEQNGIYTYDRRPKFDLARLKAINTRAAAYEKDPPLELPSAAAGNGRPARAAAGALRTAGATESHVITAADGWRVLVGACPDDGQAREWRYVADAPPAAGWPRPDFDDAQWQRGRGAFGRKEGFEKLIRTPWTGKDIWLRQEFTRDGKLRPTDHKPVGEQIARALLVLHYDNAAEVYLNGELIWKAGGWNDAYAGFDVTDAVRRALRTGRNVLAIHCHQDEGGQFIDAALLLRDGLPQR
ncbi:MAG: sugar-binding domain-containing protein [Planctomycetota bacterium]